MWPEDISCYLSTPWANDIIFHTTQGDISTGGSRTMARGSFMAKIDWLEPYKHDQVEYLTKCRTRVVCECALSRPDVLSRNVCSITWGPQQCDLAARLWTTLSAASLSLSTCYFLNASGQPLRHVRQQTPPKQVAVSSCYVSPVSCIFIHTVSYCWKALSQHTIKLKHRWT